MDLAPAHQPHPPAPKVVNGLSVDVEDWFQVGAFETTIERGDWDGCELRVERNVETILALFERAGVKATFFTLGWVAERVPQAGMNSPATDTITSAYLPSRRPNLRKT